MDAQQKFKEKIKKLKFTPALKKRWLSMLRSGKIKQAHDTLIQVEALRRDTNYCCLAVLGRAAGLSDQEMDDFCSGTLAEDFTGKGFLLPKRTQDILSQLNDNGSEKGPFNRDGDKVPWNFRQIADYVEKHVKVRK